MHSPKTSTHHHHHHHMQQLHVVAAENDSSLLCQDKQPFFLRLLQRDNSLRGSSTRFIADGLVPFIWEASAGSPKPDLLNNPYNDDHNHFLIRPLTPPPRLQSPRHDSFNQSRNNINPDNDSQPRRSFTSTLKTVLSGRRTGFISASNSLLSSSLSPRSSLDENFLSSASLKSSNRSFSASNHGVPSPPEDDMEGPAAANALKEGFAELRMQSTQPQNTTLMIRSKYKKRASPMTKGCFCFLPTRKG